MPVDDLSALPATIAVPILTAWDAKENLFDLLATTPVAARIVNTSALLYRFYHRCAEGGLPELERLAGKTETWWPAIRSCTSDH